jgi:hypothetical protein
LYVRGVLFCFDAEAAAAETAVDDEVEVRESTIEAVGVTKCKKKPLGNIH